MTTTITGLGSGFDIDSWVSQLVSAKESSLVTPLEEKLTKLNTKSSSLSNIQTKFNTLKSALKTFSDTIYGSSSDIWSNNTINSTNSQYVDATSSGSVASGDISIEVQQVATATTARSTSSLGLANESNLDSILYKNVANGQTTEGTFSMFLNGKQYEIDIDDNDSIQDILDKINNNEDINGKITASVEDGKMKIAAANESDSLVLGSAGDTSNFVSAFKLFDSESGSSYKSEYAISSFNTKTEFGSDEIGLDGLTFEDGSSISINGVSFDVDSSMTLDKLITKINGNSDVNVQASFDSLTNKLVLTSTETGQKNISLSEDGTNLLQKLGLTELNSDGEEALASGSQELGKNAIAYVNGNKVISTSNTITGESSGISNLSINVKKPTGNYSGNEDDDSKVTLSVSPDYSAVKDALSTFVKAYNDVVTTTKNAIASDGSIGTDASLNSVLTNIKSITSMVGSNDGSLSLLSDIGISTSSSDATNLSIDDDKLEEALSENFDSVKALLSDGYTSETDNGLFDRLLKTVNSALDSTNGYFTNATTSVTSQIKSMNSRIERANTQLTNYQTRITNQFNTMDSTMSALNTQLTTFQSYFS